MQRISRWMLVTGFAFAMTTTAAQPLDALSPTESGPYSVPSTKNPPRQVGTPAKITHVDPDYPAIPLGARIQGSVVLQVTIGTDGRVKDARVIESKPLLDEPALRAVAKWVYDARGMTAPVTTTVTVPFTMILSSNVADLRAVERDTWVVGKIVRIEKLTSGWDLHLEASSDVFVRLPPGPDLDVLQRRTQSGDSLIGKTVGVKGRPREVGGAIRIAPTVGAIKIINDALR